MVGAVIYVRVSTKEQTENLSLPTQLRACEDYCRRHGYEILERFHEEGESAKTTDRSQLQALLKYCRAHKGKVHFVVVYNLTRFAREKYDHFALRAHLQSLGISLRSATEPIDDTSTGKLMKASWLPSRSLTMTCVRIERAPVCERRWNSDDGPSRRRSGT
jgi:DNA invertase Pin-like site-specific DNA recombinase